MAATMIGLPLTGYNRYNRDGEADGGGKMGMNELDGSDDDRPTSEGSDGPQYGGDDGGEEMGSHSQAAIHTMSHVILTGMELVATMYRLCHTLFCSAFSREYATDGSRIAHKWTIRGADASALLPHVFIVAGVDIVAGVVSVGGRLGACKGSGRGVSFCINARIAHRATRLCQNCLHPHLVRKDVLKLRLVSGRWQEKSLC